MWCGVVWRRTVQRGAANRARGVPVRECVRERARACVVCSVCEGEAEGQLGSCRAQNRAFHGYH